MADIPIPNGIMVTMVYTLNSQRYVNVYHCTKGSPATLANLQAVAASFRSWENLTGKTIRALTSNLVLVSTKALDGPGSPVYDEIVNPFIAGTINSPALPSFCSLVVKHTTGLGGRSYRGRTYIGAIPSGSAVLPDLVTTAYSNSVTTAHNLLRTNLASAGYTLVIASKYHGVDGSGRPIPRVTGFMTPIINSEAGTALDTQRHRKLSGII